MSPGKRKTPPVARLPPGTYRCPVCSMTAYFRDHAISPICGPCAVVGRRVGLVIVGESGGAPTRIQSVSE